ncbi:MAG: redox-sensing transcriptional repressor Rex [Clostridiales bacterium]|nr:redox-sensing transcriptional repressor Rex [Clostridia bacterium]MCR4563990.1 redox-sensing transcriptional repressor Rex [Clostridiales bacterium]
MKKANYISLPVIKRLPRYYRFLEGLRKNGIEKISSNELSRRMGLTASQIRQDLNCFGGFGQQGYGYNIEQLYTEIGKILGVDKNVPTILIGAGNLGRAIATHMEFSERGFDLIGVFDKNEALAGQMIKGLPIRHISGLYNFCRDNSPAVAVLCIPEENAKEIVEQLVKLNVKGIWNFTHYNILGDFPSLSVENVHLSDSLMTLSYQLNNSK